MELCERVCIDSMVRVTHARPFVSQGITNVCFVRKSFADVNEHCGYNSHAEICASLRVYVDITAFPFTTRNVRRVL